MGASFRGDVRFDPLPGGKGDVLISGKILRRALGLIVRSGQVELQERVGLVPEKGVPRTTKFNAVGSAPAKKELNSLIRVPSGQQGT